MDPLATSGNGGTRQQQPLRLVQPTPRVVSKVSNLKTGIGHPWTPPPDTGGELCVHRGARCAAPRGEGNMVNVQNVQLLKVKKYFSSVKFLLFFIFRNVDIWDILGYLNPESQLQHGGDGGSSSLCRSSPVSGGGCPRCPIPCFEIGHIGHPTHGPRAGNAGVRQQQPLRLVQPS